jgi:hypothetical protein
LPTPFIDAAEGELPPTSRRRLPLPILGRLCVLATATACSSGGSPGHDTSPAAHRASGAVTAMPEPLKTAIAGMQQASNFSFMATVIAPHTTIRLTGQFEALDREHLVLTPAQRVQRRTSLRRFQGPHPKRGWHVAGRPVRRGGVCRPPSCIRCSRRVTLQSDLFAIECSRHPLLMHADGRKCHEHRSDRGERSRALFGDRRRTHHYGPQSHRQRIRCGECLRERGLHSPTAPADVASDRPGISFFARNAVPTST